jgi:pyruvate,water dikinase
MTMTASPPTWLVPLTDAGDEQVAGSKAAALSRAAAAGLPVLDALVLTCAFTRDIDGGTPLAGHAALDAVLEQFGDEPLVVRSSSTVEDQLGSSMAGRFASVLEVRGLAELTAAVRTVLDSRRDAVQGTDLPEDHAIAVLIQPFVAAQRGGVLFGVEPVTGRSDRLLVVAGDDPAQVVDGTTAGTRNELDHRGDRVDDGDDDTLPAGLRRELVDLAARCEDVFGGPQDIEWLIDQEGTLRLLQSRPVTTPDRGRPIGPLYGPGPVAETFPDPLSPLECDLWVPPLREAMAEALVIAGAVRREELDGRPLVVAPGGRVAVDLEITGEVAPRGARWRRLAPAPAFRRVRAAWRIGRLRAALPDLALDIIHRTDEQLRGVPTLHELTDRQLVALLDRCQRVLVSLHGHEILMGLLIDPDDPEVTGASVALRVLGEARRDGRDDAAIVRDNSVVLALVPPRIQAQVELPPTPPLLPPSGRSGPPVSVAGVRREALRLRVRWVQELSARAAWEIGLRMERAGRLERVEDARNLSLDDLRMIHLRWAAATGSPPAPDEVDPLPGTFRLSDTGHPIPTRRRGVADEAIGAGGGTGTGPVTHEGADPPEGAVLVTTTLRPELAPVLGRLAGLVAETGNPLAHLAILAREAGVPTVVGVTDAVDRFPEGLVLTISGATGQVRVVEPSNDGAHPTAPAGAPAARSEVTS